VLDEYLRATDIIDSDSPSIREKAEELTTALRTDSEKATALYYYVRDSIRFSPYAPGHLLEHNRASAVLDRGQGFCYQKAIVLAAMTRAIGIPARLGFADIRNHQLSEKFLKLMYGSNVLVYHGYTELYLNGRWVAATPAYDARLCRGNGFIPVDFDGENDARFHKHTACGDPHIEYIRQRGHYADLPWEEILKARDDFLADLGVDVEEFMGRWLADQEGV
jgi:transglutaminase-like putative cysteine protease